MKWLVQENDRYMQVDVVEAVPRALSTSPRLICHVYYPPGGTAADYAEARATAHEIVEAHNARVMRELMEKTNTTKEGG